MSGGRCCQDHSCADVEQLLAWYNCREGHNFLEQNVKKALYLAAASSHPFAVWLTNVFVGWDVGTFEEAYQVLVCCGDKQAVCFAAFLMGWSVDNDLLRRAACMGDSLAQAWMAREARGRERFALAAKAVAQCERDGNMCGKTKPQHWTN
jgi:hypothetical protein